MSPVYFVKDVAGPDRRPAQARGSAPQILWHFPMSGKLCGINLTVPARTGREAGPTDGRTSGSLPRFSRVTESRRAYSNCSLKRRSGWVVPNLSPTVRPTARTHSARDVDLNAVPGRHAGDGRRRREYTRLPHPGLKSHRIFLTCEGKPARISFSKLLGRKLSYCRASRTVVYPGAH